VPALFGPFWGLIVKKQIDISFLWVCPLIDDKLRHNIVKVAVEPRAAGEWFRSEL